LNFRESIFYSSERGFGNGGKEMPRQDADYYAARAKQERAMAEAASDACARRTHQMLAEHYQRIADGAVREVGSPQQV
jgi:hypothetical protein